MSPVVHVWHWERDQMGSRLCLALHTHSGHASPSPVQLHLHRLSRRKAEQLIPAYLWHRLLPLKSWDSFDLGCMTGKRVDDGTCPYVSRLTVWFGYFFDFQRESCEFLNFKNWCMVNSQLKIVFKKNKLKGIRTLQPASLPMSSGEKALL